MFSPRRPEQALANHDSLLDMRSPQSKAGALSLTPSSSGSPRSIVGGNTDLWFIAIVFFTTLAILVIQVVLGFMANSLVLLADSAHSGADVLSYGLNWGVEYLKVTSKADRLDSRPFWGSFPCVAYSGRCFGCMQGHDTETDVATLADEIGCVLSTVVLVVATGSATAGAVSRIVGGEAQRSNLDRDYSEIGHALLFFACLSTIANAGTLMLYVRWTRSVPAPAGSFVELTSVESSLPSRSSDHEEPDPFVFHNVAALEHSPSGRQPRTPGRKKKKGALDLNLRREFAGTSMRESLSATAGRSPEDGCRIPNCRDPVCSTPSSDKGTEDAASTASWSSWLPWDTWQPALHALVHPGCGCGSMGHSDFSGGASLREARANLNMLATLLHLVADVLRGIVIFAVACIIQVFKVPCPDKWDAWCAILVALFVVLGSLALLGRVARARCWRTAASRTYPAADHDDLSQPL